MEKLILKLELPIYYEVVRKRSNNKTILVGFNWYRNAFQIDQNNVKKYYHKLIETALKGKVIPKIGKYTHKSILAYKNPLCDSSNVIPMIEKFIFDSLQELDILTNDTVKYHTYSKGWSVVEDKLNPKLIFELYEVLEN